MLSDVFSYQSVYIFRVKFCCFMNHAQVSNDCKLSILMIDILNAFSSIFKTKGVTKKFKFSDWTKSVFYINIPYNSNSAKEKEIFDSLLSKFREIEDKFRIKIEFFLLRKVPISKLKGNVLFYQLEVLRRVSTDFFNSCLYNICLYEDIEKEFNQKMDIVSLILKKKYVLHLQPVYDSNFNVVFYEGLTRLCIDKCENIDNSGNENKNIKDTFYDNEQLLIYPKDFLSLLEENFYYYLEFEQWLYAEAIKWAKCLNKKISVNIFINTSLNESDICKSIFFQDPASELIYEITERAFIQKIKTLNQIFNSLRLKGVEIYLDDFGAGNNGLFLVKELPITGIKIDKSFRNLLNEKNYNIVRNIVKLCKRLGIKSCIEGIETEAIYNMAKSIKPDYFQGFYLSMPQSADKFLCQEGINAQTSSSM